MRTCLMRLSVITLHNAEGTGKMDTHKLRLLRDYDVQQHGLSK